MLFWRGELSPGNLEESENRRQSQERMCGILPFYQFSSTGEA